MLRWAKLFLHRFAYTYLMGERITGNFDQNHVDGFEAMQEEGEADSYSEANRIAATAGLQEMGYLNGESSDTTLRATTAELSKLFLIAGVVLIGVTYFYPIELRLLAVGPMVSGLFLLAVERLLAKVEPTVSNRLRGIVGGETA